MQALPLLLRTAARAPHADRGARTPLQQGHLRPRINSQLTYSRAVAGKAFAHPHADPLAADHLGFAVFPSPGRQAAFSTSSPVTVRAPALDSATQVEPWPCRHPAAILGQ